MIGGVIIFTFITGSLSSILTANDSTKAILSEKIIFLNKLSSQFKIPSPLYNEIKKAVNYDN